MPQFLVRKLERFTRLSQAEKDELKHLTERYAHRHDPREDIACEGHRPTKVHLLLAGHAVRYKMLDNGRRQIVGFFVPGDLCDARVFILKRRDHTISTLSAARIASIPAQAFLEATEKYPRLTRALWWNTLVEEAIYREWIVNVGQRPALARTAHLLCELYVRMDAVGLATAGRCDLPLTQAEMSEALGLSLVHTNRTLQRLRALGLIGLRDGVLTVRDREGLMAVGRFDADYLHFEHEGEALDA